MDLDLVRLWDLSGREVIFGNSTLVVCGFYIREHLVWLDLYCVRVGHLCASGGFFLDLYSDHVLALYILRFLAFTDLFFVHFWNLCNNCTDFWSSTLVIGTCYTHRFLVNTDLYLVRLGDLCRGEMVFANSTLVICKSVSVDVWSVWNSALSSFTFVASMV